MQATLGIDIGTSAVKVVVVGGDGSVRARASRPYPTQTPASGFVEQSAEDWWAATCAACRDALGQAEGAAIAGVGLSGQLNGFVLLDANDRLVGDAIIWLDTRAVAEAQDLDRRFGELLRQRAATELSAIAVLSKLAWLAKHEPDRLARTRRVLLVKDFILWKLTGVAATDSSDGSATGMMDVETAVWIGELADAAGFDPKILPAILPSCAIAGTATEDASDATGIAFGTPVVPGGGDVAALAVGCGVVERGVLGVTLGTAGHVVLSEAGLPAARTHRGFWHISHAEPGLSIWLGLVMSGGLSLAWLHRLLSSWRDTPLKFEDMVAFSAEVPPGARGLAFAPFLEGAATPYSAPEARAAFSGLSSSHGAAEMVVAVMEGVAFNVRQSVELFETLGGQVDEIRVAEGGARVDRWCQILADVLQRPLVRIEELDASSVGAALMAQVGLGAGTLADVVARTVAFGQRFEPDPCRAPAYAEAYQRYLDLAGHTVGIPPPPTA